MTARLHLICRSALGVTCLDPKAAVYRSESWVLTTQEVEALPGSRVYLHETKSEPAYFGGTVIRADPVGAPEDRLT